MPKFIYGTAWKEEDTERCVYEAVQAGFRAIDTANQRKHYFEEGVGNALQKLYGEGSVKREDLFLQTKYTHMDGQDSRLPYDPNAKIQDQVLQSFESSLKHLNTDYIDSLVLHGPSGYPDLSEEDFEAWNAIAGIKKKGLTKEIGISNVNSYQLTLLLEKSSHKPKFVQNRCYAKRGWDKAVRDICIKEGIIYQGFSLLTANVWVFKKPVFVEILNHLACTPSQLIFALALEAGMIPLTGTTKRVHMQEDLDSFKVELSHDHVSKLLEIGE